MENAPHQQLSAAASALSSPTETAVLVVGHGLAGLAAAAEIADAGHQVVLLDQESEANLGGQAHWSLGGLFFVDSPEQRRLGIKDSAELAWADWQGSAQFDRPEDYWPRQWAQAYVDFASGEKRSWLRAMGHRSFPIVGWAERGDGRADGHGNSVPRFHLTWGTGPGLVEPFERRVRVHAEMGRIRFCFRHRVDSLDVAWGPDGASVRGVHGAVLAEDGADRGKPSNRDVISDFHFTAQAVVLASGGIGGNLELVRRNWPERLGTPPEFMVAGVPAHVDGRLIGIASDHGVRVINSDRMWHYVEGLRNWDPIWDNHGIRILPGPSSLWLDALGRRLPAPYLPGFDTLGTLRYLRGTGFDHSWFVLTQKIIAKEFALSGSEQNPDLTGRDVKLLAKRAVGPDAPGPVEAFKKHGADFVIADTLTELVAGMNALTPHAPLDEASVRAVIEARDSQFDNPFSKDTQAAFIQAHRNYRGDKFQRQAAPHRLLDPKAGPLIAVKLNILTRKTLGGLETDLSGACLDTSGRRIDGLYAVGEAAGFGGGGMMGYNALEGTFLGGCLFTGRTAGRSIAARL